MAFVIMVQLLKGQAGLCAHESAVYRAVFKKQYKATVSPSPHIIPAMTPLLSPHARLRTESLPCFD
jgi:hypothetical protein